MSYLYEIKNGGFFMDQEVNQLNNEQIIQQLSKQINDDMNKILSEEIGAKSIEIANLKANIKLLSNQLNQVNQLYSEAQNKIKNLEEENQLLKADTNNEEAPEDQIENIEE
jgi:hypothetical protein